jgi:hypothetical protein
VSLKVIEVLVLLIAGVLFFAWQWRDLKKAKEITRQQNEKQARAGPSPDSNKSDQAGSVPPGSEKGPDGG